MIIDCNTNCHKKCEKYMPNHCGLNKKIFADIFTKMVEESKENKVKSTEPIKVTYKLFLLFPEGVVIFNHACFYDDRQSIQVKI